MPILDVLSLFQDIGASGGNTTSTNGRDPNYQLTGMFHTTPGEGIWVHGAPASFNLWVHLRVRTGGIPTAPGADGVWWEMLDENNTVYADGDASNGGAFCRTRRNGTTTGVGFNFSANTTYTWDINFRWEGGFISTFWYLNGGLASFAVQADGGLTPKMPDRFRLRNNDIDNNFTITIYFNEGIAMDNEDTRGMRLATLEPDLDGFYTDWLGGAAELGDTSVATVAAANTIGNRHSSTLTPYNGATSSVVRAVVGKADAARGLVTAPGSITQFLRIGATDYDGTPVSYAVGERKNALQIWDLNPDTGLPWNTADLAGVEIGLLASA